MNIYNKTRLRAKKIKRNIQIGIKNSSYQNKTYNI